jgi:hypothetical protein
MPLRKFKEFFAVDLAGLRYATPIRSLLVEHHTIRVARSVWERQFAAA